MIDSYKVLEQVRNQAPVVHHLTNWVTIYDCANIVKVFGGSPVMAHAIEEAADMAGIASALVLNIGTLTPEMIEAMKAAARTANKNSAPVLLDVCGAGATKLRDDKCFELLNEVRIDIIKGNASEVARIAGEDIRTRGVDSTEVGKDLMELAVKLASDRKCTVVITGPEDYVTDGKNSYIISNGHELMKHVVGTGCMAASVIGMFTGVETDLAKAAAAGLCCYEIAAEKAAKKCSGPGSFKEALYDAAYSLGKADIDKMRKIEEA